MQRKNYQNCSMEELAQIVTSHLADKDIEVILVGGMAVSLYTDNRYLTKDIDLVDISYQNPATLRAAMSEIGFKKQGKNYHNPTTEIQVEFPSGQLAVGDELIKKTTVIKGTYGDIPVLTAADVVKDRLSAYFHWADFQGLVQALAVMLNHEINGEAIREFCEREASEQAFEKLEMLYQSLREEKVVEMETIENIVVAEQLEDR